MVKKLVIAVVIISSLILGFHNATLYNPRHGFDGKDHLDYMKYLYKYHDLPPTSMLKETHQSPLYYVLGTILYSLTDNWKTPQYINIFVLWLIIGMVGIGLNKLFKEKTAVLIGMFSLAALPMLNIFPPMITNELLNTFWIISIAVAALFIVSAKRKKEIILYSTWFTASFILGYWTKVSVIIILPTITLSYGIAFLKNYKLRKTIFLSFLISIILAVLFSLPLFLRARQRYSGSDITIPLMQKVPIRKNYDFFYRLDWIPKIDMYNAQYYSLIGGAWNSFWTDGHNAVTPFVKFHKKSFILWLEGFILLPIAIYGLMRLWRNKKIYALIAYTIGATMLFVYIYINRGETHYSAVRLTYEMGIVLPYAFGIASAFQNKKLKPPIALLLAVQFIIMVSFFWIEPWWHVTK